MLERGSLWRRWDLHVHTPDTAVNDQYGSWDEYVTAIEGQTEVSVIGVTDYLLLTNYSKMLAFKQAGRLNNVDYLLPNIEFRLAPPTDKDTAVNIHLLVSPEDPAHEQHINNALARLHWQYNKQRYSCTPDQLMALGRAIDETISSNKDALSKGVEQFKIDFSSFREWFNGEPWLVANSLVAVSGNKDGLSGFLLDGGWAAMREEITRLSHVIFSGRPKEAKFWLGSTGSPQDVEFMQKLGGSKPCIHGSDAHKLSDLFKPEDDRFCWIKADPNFDGLRQILLEPSERVYIGPTPPIYHDQARVIDTVTLSSAGGWFDKNSIPLNSGLVSIIGQKGSGKSALAELIAFGAGSWEPTDGSFISRAGQYLAGMSIALKWADGDETTVVLSNTVPSNGRVRFLSQRFVEKLCADDTLGDDLVREIEAVIFNALDPTDTLNASTFQELRDARTETTTAQGDRLREDIGRLIRDEIIQRAALNKIPEKIQACDKLKVEAVGLMKQMPQPTTAGEAQTQKNLQQARTLLSDLQNKIGALKQRRQKIVDVRGRVQGMARDIQRYRLEIVPLLDAASITEADHELFIPKFDDRYESKLKARDAQLASQVSALDGAEANPASNTVRYVSAEIERLSRLESADKARHERVKAIQTRLAAIAVEMARLEAEIAQRDSLQSDVAASRTRRLDSYVSYFSNLAEEQKTLENLYKPVHQKLADREHEQDLKFSIRWEVDLARWLERGGQLMDQRRILPYGTMTELARKARQVLVPAWASGDPNKIREAHESFMQAFRSQQLLPGAYLRTGVTLSDLLNWLYDVQHVSLNYGLKYRGTDMEKLSPGTKGIVLLILYLGLDERDTRPLIVDQPDENLDNESIFELLTTYFRSAKKRRQIILITHNPNLVVNGDSDQVVVATAVVGENGLPRISYAASSLENSNADGSGIRQKTCRILEGGTDAFQRRERRYALSP